MDLWKSPSRMLEAMESDASPKTVNPLENTVFHARADIRIESASQLPLGTNIPIERSDQPPEQSSPTEEEKANQKHADSMRIWWDSAIVQHMDLPDGYRSAAVMIVKWVDELDELHTRDEAEELNAVFRDLFHFTTEIVELNVSSRPQHQLRRYMSTFIDRYDGPDHLLIIYYTGHGVYREKDNPPFLELCGSNRQVGDKRFDRGLNIEARANWNHAEELLASDAIEGDVLTILDTCYSSNHTKSGKEYTRSFELLSACSFDSTTASPGPHSFTRALIDAMKELLNEYQGRPFTTFHLNQRINLDIRRRDTQSQLWDRLKRHDHGRQISLGPLRPTRDRERRPTAPHPPRGYLTLRFALRDDSLNREQIEHLAKQLAKALSNKSFIGLRRIDWLGLTAAHTTHFGRVALAMYAIAQWKRVVHKRRAERRMNEGKEKIKPSLSMDFDSGESVSSSPTRKRNRDGDIEDVITPETKRGTIPIPRTHNKPPSPSVSKS